MVSHKSRGVFHSLTENKCSITIRINDSMSEQSFFFCTKSFLVHTEFNQEEHNFPNCFLLLYLLGFHGCVQLYIDFVYAAQRSLNLF